MSFAIHYCHALLDRTSNAKVDTLRSIIDRFNSTDEETVHRAMELVFGYGAEAVGPLIEAVEDKSYGSRFRRAHAAFALSKIGPPAKAAIPVLLESLVEEFEPRPPQANVHANAYCALSQIGSAAVPALIKALNDPNVYVQVGAARALEMMGPPDANPAIPALTEAANDSNNNIDVRALAQDALRKLQN